MMSKQRMLKQVLICLLGVALLAAMLCNLPGQAAIIRALDLELHLHELCSHGSEEACALMSRALPQLRDRVEAATENLQGVCLYADEDGVALRLKSGGGDVVVADLSMRATALVS